jgi:Uma2 family endonuclease
MADAAQRRMTEAEFLAWQQRQEPLYELVDGVPQLYRDLTMMAGGSRAHDRIITNIIIALGNQLGDGPCRPATADLSVRTKIGAVRRADVLVTCDTPSADKYEADDPRMVVEVLSPSNSGVAWDRKLNEYRRHPTLDYILLVDATLMDVKLYARSGASWDDADFSQVSDRVDLPKLGCSLTLDTLYRGTELAVANS